MENIALTSIIYCNDLTYSVSVSTISWNMYINFLRWKTNKDEPTIYWLPLSGVFKSVVFNLNENESKLTSGENMSVLFVRFTTHRRFHPIIQETTWQALSMFNTLWKVPGVWTRPRIHKMGCTLTFDKWYEVLSWGQLRLSLGGRDGKLSVICLWGKCDLEIKERPKKDNLELCIPASGLLKRSGNRESK